MLASGTDSAELLVHYSANAQDTNDTDTVRIKESEKKSVRHLSQSISTTPQDTVIAGIFYHQFLPTSLDTVVTRTLMHLSQPLTKLVTVSVSH